MKATCRPLLSVFLLVIMISCSLDEGTPGITIVSNAFDFSESDYGFTGGFSDYPAGTQDSVLYELQYAYAEAPGGQKAMMISGNNRSDDLFMFVKKKLTGLQPVTDYTVTIDVEFTCNAKPGGEAESIFLKVGATDTEPKSVIDDGNFIMNIDKGNQGESGVDMITIGNVAPPYGADVYTKRILTNSSSIDSPLEVRSNNHGELWLIIGTDSGFTGTTTLYYTAIDVVLSASN